MAIIGVLLYGVFASWTRSAWISVFTVLFFIQFLISDLWKRTLPIFILGFQILLLMWERLSDSSMIVSRALNTNSITPRLLVMRLGWERFLEKPFLGWGSGALTDFGLRQAGTISHNIYLSFLVDGGAILFLSFFAAISYLLIRAKRIYRLTGKNNLERNFLVVMVGNVMIFLLSGLALELRYFSYFNALFWMSAGAIDHLGTYNTHGNG
jgi:O-antigen ligase